MPRPRDPAIRSKAGSSAGWRRCRSARVRPSLGYRRLGGGRIQVERNRVDIGKDRFTPQSRQLALATKVNGLSTTSSRLPAESPYPKVRGRLCHWKRPPRHRPRAIRRSRVEPSFGTGPSETTRPAAPRERGVLLPGPTSGRARSRAEILSHRQTRNRSEGIGRSRSQPAIPRMPPDDVR